MRRFATVVLLTCFLGLTTTVSTGCYGSFSLTKKVHTWNGETSPNKWVQWLVFLGLNVVPVYPIALLADAFVINTIEFYSGSNPVGGSASIERPSPGTVIVKQGAETFRLEQLAGGKVAVYRGSERLGTGTFTAEGTFLALDDHGQPIAVPALAPMR